MAAGVTWRAGEWRELGDGRVVHLGRAIAGDLWVVDGGYEREQPSRLLSAEEVADWETLATPTEQGLVLLSPGDLETLLATEEKAWS